MDHEPFFKRGPSPLVRLTFFGLMAIALMVADARFNQLPLLRQGVGLMLHPLQQIANSPLTLVRRASEFFVTQDQLSAENDRLKQQQLADGMQLQRNQSLQVENDHLRSLLSTRERYKDRAIAVEVTSAGRDLFSHRIIVDKGASSGIQAGQAAIDDKGLVGQVTKVHLLTSEITLVIDKGQAVPVEVVRSGLRAIAFGHGQDNTLELAFMQVNMDIQNGDQLVTSGIDGTYPRGIPVAVVSKIERSTSDSFAKITCKPTAGTDRYRNLLLVSIGEASATSLAGKPDSEKREKK